MKLHDGFRHLLGRAESRVALRRLAEVHGVAGAQCLVGGREGFLPCLVDPNEQEVAGSERGQGSTRLPCGHADLFQALSVHVRSDGRSEEHTSEPQSQMRISYDVLWLT